MNVRLISLGVVLSVGLPCIASAQSIVSSKPVARSLAESPSSDPSSGQGPCSLRTLKGTYTFGYAGTYNPGAVAVRQSGLESFDGQGHFKLKLTSKADGYPAQSMLTSQLTYSVNPDCTGTLIDQNGAYADIFIDPTGDSFEYIFTGAPYMISGKTSRVSRQTNILNP